MVDSSHAAGEVLDELARAVGHGVEHRERVVQDSRDLEYPREAWPDALAALQYEAVKVARAVGKAWQHADVGEAMTVCSSYVEGALLMSFYRRMDLFAYVVVRPSGGDDEHFHIVLGVVKPEPSGSAPDDPEGARASAPPLRRSS